MRRTYFLLTRHRVTTAAPIDVTAARHRVSAAAATLDNNTSPRHRDSAAATFDNNTSPRHRVSVANRAAAATLDNNTVAASIRAADLSKPGDLYSLARRLGPRNITLHIGPTNSGKTYAALEALKNCTRGLYCSPLRLLAWEVYEKMIAAGKPCELITGQEREAWAPPRDVAPRAGEKRHGGMVISSTVECASIEEVADVCVLDEVQLLADPSRGWAWTRILLGIPAMELHVCGDPAAESLVRRLADLSGDNVDVIRYTRLSPLTVAPSAVRNWKELEPGDAVVAFSRRSLFETSKEIETTTGLRTAIIYGGLPPIVRRDQARRFNGGGGNDSSSLPTASVLVASDAIGMGLNLKIKRVVFSTLSKYDGSSRRTLNVSEIKQIAGRAGRFKSEGLVTSTESRHIATLRRSLLADTPLLTVAGVAPTMEQLQNFAISLAPRLGLDDTTHNTLHDESSAALASRVANKLPFSSILRLFTSYAQTDTKNFFIADLDEMSRVASLIDDVPLEFRDRYLFSLAPVHLDDPLHVSAYRRYARHHASRGLVSVGLRVPENVPQTSEQVASLEGVHRVFDLYIWLSRVFSVSFCFLLDAQERAAKSGELIKAGLDALGKQNLKVASTWAHSAGRFGTPRITRDNDFIRTLIDQDDREDEREKWFHPKPIIEKKRSRGKKTREWQKKLRS